MFCSPPVFCNRLIFLPLVSDGKKATQVCPQGYSCDGKNLCQCTIEQQRKHRSRISAPLLDRIDIHIEVPSVDRRTLADTEEKSETNIEVKKRINAAYERQIKRCGKTNALLTSRETETYCKLNKAEQALLEQAMEKLNLSARAYHRILRMSRTIADLDNSLDIETQHLSEAISYRSLHRLM